MRPIIDQPRPVPFTGVDGEEGLAAIAAQLAEGRTAVLTGAGISTESGIPDYRGETGRLRRAHPMTFQEFIADEANRRRYWARGFVGRGAIQRARPNAGHRAVQALHASGHIGGVVTQNVDGLHRAAGTADAVELHGALDRVRCLDCGTISPRDALDERLGAVNGDFLAAVAAHRAAARDAGQVNPDGDVELPDALVDGFRMVPCERCGGVLKPDVVFFGENVPRERVRRSEELIDEAASVLVLGSSLAVFSGLRLVRRAAKDGKPVSAITQGPTRGDLHLHARAHRPLGPTLTALSRTLGVPVPAP